MKSCKRRRLLRSKEHRKQQQQTSLIRWHEKFFMRVFDPKRFLLRLENIFWFVWDFYYQVNILSKVPVLQVIFFLIFSLHGSLVVQLITTKRKKNINFSKLTTGLIVTFHYVLQQFDDRAVFSFTEFSTRILMIAKAFPLQQRCNTYFTVVLSKFIPALLISILYRSNELLRTTKFSSLLTDRNLFLDIHQYPLTFNVLQNCYCL